MTEKKKKLGDAEMLAIINKAVDDFEGDATVLESAVGALVLGRRFGWQGIRVIHSRVAFTKYEQILSVKFRELLPDRGPDANKLRGIRIVDKIGKFWQAISSGLVSAREAAQVEPET